MVVCCELYSVYIVVVDVVVNNLPVMFFTVQKSNALQRMMTMYTITGLLRNIFRKR
jgi:hypothetical protein